MIEQIEQGNIITPLKSHKVADIPWNKHATCEGVYLKHLITGAQTDGKFSCHFVKVQAGCEISEHIHPHSWEIHEVIAGTAIAFSGDEKIDYLPGTTAAIPEGRKHKVTAGDEDVYILAKFIPALL